MGETDVLTFTLTAQGESQVVLVDTKRGESFLFNKEVVRSPEPFHPQAAPC